MHNISMVQNSLRINNQELCDLLDKISKDKKIQSHSKRVHERFPFRVESASMLVTNRDQSTAAITVATSNISKGGIAVLHTAYMHSGIKCQIDIILADGRDFTLHGRVVRCSHMIGRVHEIGIEFDSELNA